jgi:hypothetical protein
MEATRPTDAVRFSLKSDDQPVRDREELDRTERESIQRLVETALARARSTDVSLALTRADTDFSCEWWPPD